MYDIRKEYSIEKFEEKVKECLAALKKTCPLILIQGGYGKNNLGDDALLLTITEKIKFFLPDAEIIALCHYPANVEKKYNIKAVSFKSPFLLKYILRCDLLIIGGGGIVNRINTFSGNRRLKILDMKGKFLFLTSLLVKLRRKKVIFYGVGMTSIPDVGVKILMYLTLRFVDVLGVRDRVTYETLQKMHLTSNNVFLIHDPALDFKEKPEQKMSRNSLFLSKYVVISIRAVGDRDITERVERSIKTAIKFLAEKCPGIKIVLLPVSMHPDKELENDYLVQKRIYDDVKRQIPNVKLVCKYLHPSVTRQILAGAEMIIMARLHGLILSYDYHIQTIVLSYDTKVSEFADMGKYEYILNYDTLSGEQIIQKMEYVLGKR